LIKSEGEIGLETITHSSLITVIDPGGNGRDGYAALEHGSHVGGERHSGGVTAVTPTPYAGPVRVDPFVSLLQSSADIKGFFVSVPSAKVNCVLATGRITHAVTAIVSSTSTVPIFLYISNSILLPL